jgi:hypothetical protein
MLATGLGMLAADVQMLVARFPDAKAGNHDAQQE